ncbi:hypothetical protein Q9966_008287 [Columba livia]|nr:hypothetical protein Q9966_008287 [Columba livia]
MGLLHFAWCFLVIEALFGWLRSSSQSVLAHTCTPRGLVLHLHWLPPPGPAHGAGDEYHQALQERMLLLTEVQDGLSQQRICPEDIA